MKARWPKDKKHPDRRGEWTTPKQAVLPFASVYAPCDWRTQMDAYIGAMNVGPGGMLSVDYLSNDGETFRQQYLGQPRIYVDFEGGRRAGRSGRPTAGGRLRQAAERLRSRQWSSTTVRVTSAEIIDDLRARLRED